MTSPRHLRWTIALSCVALIVLRVGGAHLHLCFDGSEPPVSYHVGDSSIHHSGGHDDEGAHSDRDVAIGEDLTVKKPFGDLDLALALAAISLLFLFPRPRQESPRAPRTPPSTFRGWRLRPPLRGPPTPA
jgi:hypothetical protein